MLKHILLALFLVLSVSVCGEATTSATHPSLRTAGLPPLIPAKEFFTRRHEAWGHKISPDGKKLAWIQPVRGKPTLHVRRLEDGVITVMSHSMPVTQFGWTVDSSRLLFQWRRGRRTTSRLSWVDTRSPRAAPRDLTPFDDADVRGYIRPTETPESILVQMSLGKGRAYNLYKLDLDTGNYAIVAVNDGNTRLWVTSRAGRVLARLRNRTGGGWRLEASDGADGWTTVLRGGLIDVINVVQNIPDERPAVVVRTDANRDTLAVLRVDLVTGMQEVLFERTAVDVFSIVVDRQTYTPLRVMYHDGLPRYHYSDREMGNELKGLLVEEPSAFNMDSLSLDHRRLTIRVQTDRIAASAYLIDRRSGTAELLSSHPLNEYTDSFSRTQPIQFTARDGLPISGYLTIPHGTRGKRLPMVLKVHGGPWFQDLWNFDRDTQFLANRGYAVLEVNFRGSSGFGKSFMDKGRREFGRKMQDDLIDAVDWAIAEGHADPEKVAIYGHSYGGYAALVGLTKTPRKFAAGIDAMGVSDLVLQVNSFLPHNKTAWTWWTEFVGNPNVPDDHRELLERSPITHVDRIERPLLIVHGAKDAQVSLENSNRLVDKLRKKGLPVEYLLFPDEGHVILRRKNALEFAHRLEAFLAKHLGGRAGSPG